MTGVQTCALPILAFLTNREAARYIKKGARNSKCKPRETGRGKTTKRRRKEKTGRGEVS